jgi:hypothetical protein
MIRSFLSAASISIIVLALGGPAAAVGPVFWEISKQEEIARGDARGVSIAENGAITLAPTFWLVYDTGEAYIWSSASDRQGNIYLGTGHEGRIFKVDKDGRGALLYDAPELDVTALATDPDGNLYAGTSPDGKIYKITPDGKASVFYDPEDKYIWSLLFDPSSSALYAGTGNKGVIYRIDASGRAEVLADTNETNIVSLALRGKGELLAGTDPSGLVLSISPSGKTFALLDSPMQEIHRIAVARDGSIFALGVNAQLIQQRDGEPNPHPASARSTNHSTNILTNGDEQEIHAQSSYQSSDASSLPQQSKPQGRAFVEGARSAIFRILQEGSSEAYWSSRDAVGFALDLLPDGRLLVGTGNKGRIYSIAPDRSSTLLIQSPEDQTSTLLTVGREVFATSSNLGRLYRIGQQTEVEGTYISPVRDTKFSARWGIITWRGSGDIKLQTRTGNTETPDATWSEWSAPYRDPSGEQIKSPPARFIQWRATLHQGATTAKLQSVVVAYLPRNQAPEVTSIIALPPGVAMQEMPVAVDPSVASSGLDPQLFGVATSAPPRRFFQKGARTLTWQASDPNDDPVVFKIFYRATDDDQWKLLADKITQNYYTIDGNRLPDGSYQFKIQASDLPGNPEELALTDEAISDVIEIDNTPPSIKTLQATSSGLSAEVLFEAVDSTSRIIRGEYSVDGGPWLLVFPEDGIPDSPRERFKIKVTFPAPGEHVIAFRCADSNNNVGTAKATMRAER